MTPVEKIVAAVKEAGGRTFEVGGAVRDRCLGLPCKDTDLLVTGVPADVLQTILPGRAELVGQAFGVFKVTIDGETIDVAMPRTELSTGDGHKDFEVKCDHRLSVEEDLCRRDFTMNAIAIECGTGAQIDPFNGRHDISDRLIKAVGDANERFEEDPLRILRAIRFVAKLGFNIETNTALAIQRHASKLNTVAAERVAEELIRLLMNPDSQHVGKALRCARDLGVLENIIPEFKDSFKFDQRSKYHCFTVDEHVFKAGEHVVHRGASSNARLAVLLHDIAKPRNFTVDEDGQGHFYEHEYYGAKVAKKILQRLKFSVDDTNAVTTLVREHLRPSYDASEKVLRRFVAQLGPFVDDAIMVREGDLAAHARESSKTAQEKMDSIRARILGLGAIVGFGPANLALKGDEIAREFKVEFREIGELKKAATQAVVDGLVPNEREAILKFLKESRAEVKPT